MIPIRYVQSLDCCPCCRVVTVVTTGVLDLRRLGASIMYPQHHGCAGLRHSFRQAGRWAARLQADMVLMRLAGLGVPWCGVVWVCWLWMVGMDEACSRVLVHCNNAIDHTAAIILHRPAYCRMILAVFRAVIPQYRCWFSQYRCCVPTAASVPEEDVGTSARIGIVA